MAGGPKGSTWKHPFVLDMDVLKTIPFWFAGLFLLALLGVLGLTALVLGRQFRREQPDRGGAFHADMAPETARDREPFHLSGLQPSFMEQGADSCTDSGLG